MMLLMVVRLIVLTMPLLTVPLLAVPLLIDLLIVLSVVRLLLIMLVVLIMLLMSGVLPMSASVLLTELSVRFTCTIFCPATGVALWRIGSWPFSSTTYLTIF